MRVTFVLPASIRIPMGGVKVVYAHASGLAARGHEVVVVGPNLLGGGAKGMFAAMAMRLRDTYHNVGQSPYYEAEGVQTLIVPTIKDRHLPDADVVIATGVQTAPWVRDLDPTKGAKAYFLQHVETFIDLRTIDTWHYPLAKITIAKWIKRRVEEEGESVLGIVPNAINPKEFFPEHPVESRGPSLVALYHRHHVKGPEVLIDALQGLKASVPELTANIFCSRAPSHKMPLWVKVHVRPTVEDLRRIYNQAAIVWSTSRSEGWGLVTMEAAACGCAVVASATEGIQEYLQDGVSARLVKVGDAVALAEATVSLFQNPAERIQLAKSGQEAVRQFTWQDSTAELERILVDYLR